jgi:putative tricarboxylic transport membrane protein
VIADNQVYFVQPLNNQFMKFLTDRKYALVMLAFSMVYCYLAISLEADYDPTKEKYFPFLLSIAMIILSVLLFIFPSQHKNTWPKGQQLIKIILLAAAILVYSLSLAYVGFLILATILMGVCMWVFGGTLKWIAPVSVVVTISFYIIFDRVLGLNLPAGILKFLN